MRTPRSRCAASWLSFRFRALQALPAGAWWRQGTRVAGVLLPCVVSAPGSRQRSSCARCATCVRGRVPPACAQERLASGQGLPQYIKDHIIYYAGPAKTPEGYASGSFGPTTAGASAPPRGTPPALLRQNEATLYGPSCFCTEPMFTAASAGQILPL